MNNFSIDSKGIGEALQRSAAAFNAANTDLSKSIALITATNEVVQDPDAVGSMWTTVSARLRGAETELSNLNEETDEYVKSTSKLRNLVKTISGVDIMQDEDTFKDIYTIVDEIAQTWDSISDINQASLLEGLAGKRQSNRLAAVLNNYTQLEKAYETAENSAGSAAREQERYQKSIQYSIDSAKASLQELANDFLSSDILKFLIDVGNEIVKITDNIVELTGALTPILGLGAGVLGFNNKGLLRKPVDEEGNIISDSAFSLFGLDILESKKQLQALNAQRLVDNKALGAMTDSILHGALPEAAFKEYIEGADGLSDSVVELADNCRHFEGTNEEMVDTLMSGIQPLEEGEQAASGFGNALKGTLINMGFVAGISLLITGITTLVDNLIVTREELGELADESANAAKQSQADLDEVNSKLEETRARLQELSSKDSLTLVEKGEYEELTRQNEALSARQEILNNINNAKQKKAAEDALNFLTREEISTADYKDVIGTNGGMITASGQVIGGTDTTAQLMAQRNKDIIDETFAAQEKLNEAKLRYQELEKSDATPQELENAQSTIDSYAQDVADKLEQIDKRSASLFDETTGAVKEGYEDIAGRVKTLYDFVNTDVTLSETSQDLAKINQFFDGSSSKNLIKQRLEEATKEGKLATQALKELGLSVDDIGVPSSTLNEYFGELTTEVDTASEAVINFDGTLETLNSAMESVNQGVDYDTLYGHLEKLQTLHKQGMWGTDEFQSFAEFISPDVVSSEDNLKDFKYDAEAYLKAYKDYIGKIKKYYTEDPSQGLWEAGTDLGKAGLAKISYDKNGLRDVDFTDDFTSSAQAAKAFGLSIEATEPILKKLQEQGFQFGENFEWAGEKIEEYSTALSKLEEKATELEKFDNSKLIEGLSDEIDEYKTNLEIAKTGKKELTKNEIVRIEFVTNLLEQKKLLEQTLQEAQNSGYGDKVTNSSAITAAQDYVEQIKKGMGLNKKGVEIPLNLSLLESNIKDVQKELTKATDDDSRIAAQKKLIGLYKQESKILEDFAGDNKEITPKVNTKKINKALTEFFDDNNYTIKLEGEVDPNSVKKQLKELGAHTNVEFTAQVTNDSGEKIEQQVRASMKDDGSIHFYPVIDGVAKVSEELTQVKNENTGEITLVYTGDTQDVDEKIDNTKQKTDNLTKQSYVVKFTDNGSISTLNREIDELHGNLARIDGTTAVVSVKTTNTGNNTNNNSKPKGKKGKNNNPSTVSNVRPSGYLGTLGGSAFANGSFNRDIYDAITPKARTKRSETALTGELGPELVVKICHLYFLVEKKTI